MSTTQFELNNGTSSVSEQNLINVGNTTSKWVSSSDQHEQQLAAHIAVHTPIHVTFFISLSLKIINKLFLDASWN